MWNRFKGWLLRFMSGRYGVDALGRFLFWLYLALLLIGLIIDSLTVTLLCTAAAVFMILRILSRNHLARAKENQTFLNLKTRFIGWAKLQRDKFKDRNTHVYRACPTCKATLRLPKVPGDHTVRCPKCGNRFDVNVK